MRPLYLEMNSQLEVFVKKNNMLPPHLHKYLECIYAMEGNFSLGIGAEWIELYPHDLAIVFPDMVHQFRVDGHGPSQAAYILASPKLAGPFTGILQKCYPGNPVIRSKMVHPDIPYAFHTLLESKQDSCYFELQQAYFQILLARALPLCQLMEKKEPESCDLAWQVVSYISEHFTEEVSLTGMARTLCVSPYVLSRIFSGIFHTNFNQYLNEIRLDYASHLLRTTEKSVTDIFMDAGFASQTTFNRSFKEKYHMSPRDYRNQNLHMEGEEWKRFSESRKEEEKERRSNSDYPWQLTTGRFL